jgi:hypothetical protein
MMKKLLLASTSAFVVALASPAFAGSSSTFLLQTGNNQQATITQSGDNNSVGGSELVPFLQQNGSGALAGSGGNVITINQTGNGNQVDGDTWYVHPAAPLGAVGQSGTGNVSTIQQDGSNGIVMLQQQGHYNGTTPGYGGYIHQTNTTNGNQAIVHQAGDYNDFTITQSGSNSPNGGHNRAELTQGSYVTLGYYNLADINQAGGPNTGHRLSSGQYGNYNYLHSTQTGQLLANWFTSTQIGTGGYSGQQNQIWNDQSGSNENANVTQNGYSLKIYNTQRGTGDTLKVTLQSGNDNTITNTQDSASIGNLVQVDSQAGSNNNINSYQTGNSNVATVTRQSGISGLIDNRQSGSNGSATYDQQGTYNKAILQDQIGTYGQLNVVQETTAWNNVVVAYQNSAASSGLENKINVTQGGGSSNSAYLLQGANFGVTLPTAGSTHISGAGGTPGFNNQIVLTQDGSQNYAAISQNVNNNVSVTTQSGSNNSAIIKQ